MLAPAGVAPIASTVVIWEGPMLSMVEMHGAGAAQRHAAPEFRAGHAQYIAQHPKERRVTIDIDDVWFSVDFDAECHGTFSSTSFRYRRDRGTRCAFARPYDQEA